LPKRYMSDEEWNEQQYHYRQKLQSPQDLQKYVDSKFNHLSPEELQKEERIEILKEQLHGAVQRTAEDCLTDRQKKVISLYLLSKKQDYMGIILQVTQEAIHSRLNIAFRRLKKSCMKDEQIIAILTEIENLKK